MTANLRALLPFPKTPPIASRDYGLRLVGQIVVAAEATLGQMKPGVRIANVSMQAYSPRISMDSSLQNIHVQLTDCAARDWESFVAEFGHEIVHVLNPRIGNASYLEKGVAELFSVQMQNEFGIEVYRHNVKQYNDAVAMLRELPIDPLDFAREVRSKLGALTGFRADELREHFPEIDADLAERLCAECRTTA